MREERVGEFRLSVPTTRRERARGLLGRDWLDPDEGIWLRRCRTVHTFGMRVAIDVVLLDTGDCVLGVRHMPPGRLLLPRPRVRHVVEVAAGRGDALSRALSDRTTPRARGSDRRARA